MVSLVKQGLLSQEEDSLLKGFLSYHSSEIEENMIEGNVYTYEDLLSYAKSEKEKKEKNKKMQEELDKIISVCFVKKYTAWENGIQYVVLPLKVNNNTEKKVCGFTFSADFKDGEGNSIYYTTWTTQHIVKANSSQIFKFGATIPFDNSEKDKVKISVVDLDKLQIEYHVLSVNYDDGTTYGFEE